MKCMRFVLVVFIALGALPGRAGAEARGEVTLEPMGSGTARGTVRLEPRGETLHISGTFTGLSPGLHGIHVHEKGLCEPPAAESAGPHFNPDGSPHADHGAPERHAGDLGNIEADADGTAKISLVDSKLALHGPDSIIGRSLIVHEKRDDLKSQPAGDSGKRIACGIIQKSTG